MQSNGKVFIVVGTLIIIFGFILLSVMQTYYQGGTYYGSTYIGGSIVWGKTLGILAAKIAVIVVGWLIRRHGIALRDGR